MFFPFFILHESSWSQADFIYTVMLAGAFGSCLSRRGQGSFSHRRGGLSWESCCRLFGNVVDPVVCGRWCRNSVALFSAGLGASENQVSAPEATETGKESG